MMQGLSLIVFVSVVVTCSWGELNSEGNVFLINIVH